LYRQIVYSVIVICCTSPSYCHSDIMTIRHFLQFHEVVSVVSASGSASFMSPLILYCLYDHNSHNISFSRIPSTMARSKRPAPTTGQEAYRILRASQARLAATEAATAAATAAAATAARAVNSPVVTRATTFQGGGQAAAAVAPQFPRCDVCHHLRRRGTMCCRRRLTSGCNGGGCGGGCGGGGGGGAGD
jgi:hypothetical protein